MFDGLWEYLQLVFLFEGLEAGKKLLIFPFDLQLFLFEGRCNFLLDSFEPFPLPLFFLLDLLLLLLLPPQHVGPHFLSDLFLELSQLLLRIGSLLFLVLVLWFSLLPHE